MHFGLSEEQAMIVDTTRAFVEAELYPHEAEIERSGHLDMDVVREIQQKAKAVGLYAANMPEEMGGAGLDTLTWLLYEKELGKANKSNFLKNISKNVEIDFDRVSTNTEFPLEKFRLIGFINKGNFEKLSGKSEFTNGKYLDISLKKEKNSNRKILEIYSDIARPIVSSYKFFDGLRNGNLPSDKSKYQ